MIFHKLFLTYTWGCFYRHKTTSILSGPSVKPGQLFKLHTSSRYWCADPFIVQENGQSYVFCELMDMKTSHGLLGLATLTPGKKAYVYPIADLGCHVSYPNLFKVDGTWYMIPETSGRKTIELYQAVHFPEKWEKKAVLAQNITAVDTTVFMQDGKPYVFIYEPNGLNNALSIAELDLQANRLGKIKKVKQYTSRIGRPAGNVFSHQGRLVRPTQYGVRTYGEKIIFKEFSFDPVSWNYEEHDIQEVGTGYFQGLPKFPKPLGCHTYNCEGDIEIIDIKYIHLTLLKPIYLLLKKFRLGGYCFYENQ